MLESRKTDFLFGITDIDMRNPHADVLTRLGDLGQVVHFGPGPDERFNIALSTIDVLIIRLMQIDNATLEQATRLKAVIKAGVGVDHIDVQAATKLGIHVVISPGNHISVAESAILLMLALSRNLIQINKRVGQLPSGLGVEVYDKTLGIIGYGRVGRHLRRIAEGLGMKVLIYDPLVRDQADLASQTVELDDLLRSSDYVSLHCPLNEDTLHMIGRRELALMRQSAFLINTARGAIVDEEALCQALRERRIAGAGLDVFEREPPPPDHPLLQLDNVIATQHRLCPTHESVARQMNSIFDSAVQAYRGLVPEESVNKAMMDAANDRIRNRKKAEAVV